MCTSYAMMASSVTPPAEDKGAEEDGAVEARRAAIPIRSCLNRSYAALRRTIVALYECEVGRNGIGDKELAKEPRDS